MSDFITKQTVMLPADDFDEDDEMDERIRKVEQAKKNHVERGGLYGI